MVSNVVNIIFKDTQSIFSAPFHLNRLRKTIIVIDIFFCHYTLLYPYYLVLIVCNVNLVDIKTYLCYVARVLQFH